MWLLDPMNTLKRGPVYCNYIGPLDLDTVATTAQNHM